MQCARWEEGATDTVPNLLDHAVASCKSRKACRRQTDSKSGTEPGARGAFVASLKSRSSNEKDLLAAILSRSCGLLACLAMLLQNCTRKSTVKHCLPARLKLPRTRFRHSLSPSLPESGSTLTRRGCARSLAGHLLQVLIGQSARSRAQNVSRDKAQRLEAFLGLALRPVARPLSLSLVYFLVYP